MIERDPRDETGGHSTVTEPTHTPGADPRAVASGGEHRAQSIDVGVPAGLEPGAAVTDRPGNRGAPLAPPTPLCEGKNGTRHPGIHDGVEILAKRLASILGVEQVAPTITAALVAELNMFRRLVADHARNEART